MQKGKVTSFLLPNLKKKNKMEQAFELAYPWPSREADDPQAPKLQPRRGEDIQTWVPDETEYFEPGELD
jgi:hypothetical protein